MTIKLEKEIRNIIDKTGIRCQPNEIEELDIASWGVISRFRWLSEEFIDKYSDKVNWLFIVRCQRLSEEFVENYINLINWMYVSQWQKLSEEFIERHADKVDWECICSVQCLSEKFIEKHVNEVNWHCICSVQCLSEEFIERHVDKVNWHNVSRYQRLSEEFIERHVDKVNWHNVSQYQRLGDKFFEKYSDKIIKPTSNNNWLYTSNEKKLEAIKRCGKFEVIDNKYVIAYKGVRKDGYSVYNFRFKYEVGQTYTDWHCDCDLNNNYSYGLSAWTLKGAKDYCDEKVLKVKIAIEDIGALVNDINKLRCWGFEVIGEVE